MQILTNIWQSNSVAMVTSMLTYTLRRLHNFPRQIYSLKRFEVQFNLKVLGFVVLDSPPPPPAPAPPRSEYGWWLPMNLTHLLKPLLCCLGAWGSNNEPKKGVNFFFLTIFKKHLPIEFHSSNSSNSSSWRDVPNDFADITIFRFRFR